MAMACTTARARAVASSGPLPGPCRPRAKQGGEVRVPRRGRARGDDGVHRRGDALSENGLEGVKENARTPPAARVDARRGCRRGGRSTPSGRRRRSARTWTTSARFKDGASPGGVERRSQSRAARRRARRAVPATAGPSRRAKPSATAPPRAPMAGAAGRRFGAHRAADGATRTTLAQCVAAEETAIDAIRRRLTPRRRWWWTCSSAMDVVGPRGRRSPPGDHAAGSSKRSTLDSSRRPTPPRSTRTRRTRSSARRGGRRPCKVRPCARQPDRYPRIVPRRPALRLPLTLLGLASRGAADAEPDEFLA